MKTNETKMKVMISQPMLYDESPTILLYDSEMNGISDSEVRRIEKELREKIAKYGIGVIDSFFHNRAKF